MAVTVSYDFAVYKSEFTSAYSAEHLGVSSERDPALLTLANGGFALAYETQEGVSTRIVLEYYNANGDLVAGGPNDTALIVDTLAAGVAKSDPVLLQLADGLVVTAWTHAGSGVHATITDTAYNIDEPDSLIPGTNLNSSVPDLVQLANGNLAFVKQQNLGAADQDADFVITSGGLVVNEVALGNNSSSDERNPVIARLNNGNVAIAYEKELADGSGNFGMAIEIYTEAGATVLDQFIFDNAGNNNLRPDVVALKDGGFAVAYEDDEYAQQGITIAFFNAAGTLLGKARADGDFFSDDDVHLTVLDNGYLAVGWTDNGVDIKSTVFDPTTRTRLGNIETIESQNGQQEQSNLTALANGKIVYAWSDFNSALEDGNTDPDDQHISMEIRNFRRTWISDAAGDTMTGDSLIDIMSGNGGIDTLIGKGGDDNLDGGAGADNMAGGTGSDTYIVDNTGDSTIEAVNEGTDQVLATVSHTLRANVENLFLQGTGNINGSGNALVNLITGNSGSNILNGFAGTDTMFGNDGNDTYYVDNSGDFMVENPGNGIDIVRSSVDWFLGSNFEKLYLLGSAVSGNGNSLSNFIYGNDAANAIDGGLAADRMYGGKGNDFYTVDSTGDPVFETVSGVAGGTDTVQSVVNFTLGANVEILQLVGGSVINGTGNTLANTISGNFNNNFIDGKAGNDTLTGSLGKDNFVFTTALSAATNVDTITDFNPTDDTLRLDNAIFTMLPTGFLSAGAFHTGLSAADAGDRIIYDNVSGKIFYDSDGLGGAAQIQFAVLSGGLTMTNADIFVF
ncbi:MAG: calcium-binding protein [Aestuariivirga sp.]